MVYLCGLLGLACSSSNRIDVAVYRLYARLKTTCPSPKVRTKRSKSAMIEVAEEIHCIRGFWSIVVEEG